MAKLFDIINFSHSNPLFREDSAANMLNVLLSFLHFFLPISGKNKLQESQVDILWRHVTRDEFQISDSIFAWLEKICDTVWIFFFWNYFFRFFI